MDRPSPKLTQQQQQEQAQALHQRTSEQQTAREFSTVEEMLRFDSSRNPVPGAVADRLQQSVEREQIAPPKPWWKRLFGR